jgi:hypothetical protein
VFIDGILTTTNDALLISRLGLTDEVDGRDPALPGKAIYVGKRVTLEVAVEKEKKR